MMRMRGSCQFPLTCLLFSVLLTCFVGIAHAYTPDPPPETAQEVTLRQESVQLFLEGKFTELDKKLDDLQQDYEKGKLSDINIMHISRGFYNTSDDWRANYDVWISKNPKSYSAHLMRGIYFVRRALESRGGKYINETSSDQIRLMRENFKLALVDLKASLALTQKPIVTYYNLHQIYNQYGDTDSKNKLVDAANKIDPKNYVVRYSHLGSLMTRWGGSLEKMIAFRNQCKQDGLPDSQIIYFDQLLAKEREWLSR